MTRRMEISEQTFDRWKKSFVGLEVAELCRLRQLEEENKRLKHMAARPKRKRLSISKGIL